MRIAMLTNNYKPFVGGVPISIERLSEGLRSLGHEVYIFAPSYEDQEDEPYVIRYRSRKKKIRGEFVVPDIFDRSVEKKFEIISFDLIHVHHPVLMGYTALYLGKKYKIPVVFTYHTRYEMYLHYLKPYDYLLRHYNHNIETGKRDQLYHLYVGSEKVVRLHNRIFTNRCDLVLAPTGSMKEYLEENGTNTNIEIIPTGLSDEDFTYDIDMVNTIRSKYLRDRKYLFVSISRLEKEKNISFMLKGLERLKERMGDCFRLLLIGDGTYKEELIAEAKLLGLEDNVVFTGCIEHSIIHNYCRAGDVFLFASQSETQGIVLLEAMAAGLPVIAVKATGVNDVVYDGFNGYLSGLDIVEWENGLEKILINTIQRDWMRQNALTEARKYLSSKIAGRVEKLYKNLIFYQGMEHMCEN